MDYVTVSGTKVPALGIGTFQMNGPSCTSSVKKALEIGYRHVDTAQEYRNEAQVGQAINESEVDREDIFLTTKVWRNALDHEHVISSTQKSLEKLKTDYVDLLLIHWPNNRIPVEETLSAMNELKEQGKVKNIGISNFPVKLMEKARKVSETPIICNQVEYHPFYSQEKVLNYCQENDLMLTAYSPLARGKVIGNNVLKEIAEKNGKNEAQVTLRWLIQQENVAAIPKASNNQHIKQNFNVFDFKLTENEMERIHGLAKGQKLIDPPFAPDWD